MHNQEQHFVNYFLALAVFPPKTSLFSFLQ